MKNFAPDYRNLGGQGALTNLLTNHYASLLNAKSVVNSHEAPVVCGAKKRKKQEDLFEVIVGFNKKEKAKAYTDSSRPETMQWASKLSEFKQRKEKSKLDSHPSNVKNMQKRMERYTNVRDI